MFGFDQWCEMIERYAKYVVQYHFSPTLCKQVTDSPHHSLAFLPWCVISSAKLKKYLYPFNRCAEQFNQIHDNSVKYAFDKVQYYTTFGSECIIIANVVIEHQWMNPENKPKEPIFSFMLLHEGDNYFEMINNCFNIILKNNYSDAYIQEIIHYSMEKQLIGPELLLLKSNTFNHLSNNGLIEQKDIEDIFS